VQVKADFFDEMPSIAGISSSCGGSGGSFGGDSVPALGMAWGYCVNTRITLHRDSSHCRACPAVPLDDVDAEDPDGATMHAQATGAALAGTKRPAPHYRVYAVDAEQRRQRAEDFYCADSTAAPGSTLTKSEDKENRGKANVAASPGMPPFEKDGAVAAVEGKLPLHERVCYHAGDQVGTGGGSGAARSARVMRLQLSPVHGPAQVAYDIGALGVRGIE
jgi:hypothetical protein